MNLLPNELKLLDIATYRINELKSLVSSKPRKEMTGKEQLLYDTFSLNQYIQKKLLDKISGVRKYY